MLNFIANSKTSALLSMLITVKQSNFISFVALYTLAWLSENSTIIPTTGNRKAVSTVSGRTKLKYKWMSSILSQLSNPSNQLLLNVNKAKKIMAKAKAKKCLDVRPRINVTFRQHWIQKLRLLRSAN